MKRFTFIARLGIGGHNLFSEGERFAVADDSGKTPDLTDDGVLYLDLDKFRNGLTINSLGSVTLPLIGENGKLSSTSENLGGAMQLLKLLNLPEKVSYNNDFEIVRKGVNA